MEIAPRLNVDPAIAHGAPVITGTRVSVTIVLGSLASGMSKEDVEAEYEVSAADIEAALDYESRTN